MNRDVIDSFRGDYGFLSNFTASPVPVTLLGVSYTAPTVEHGFQGSKVLVCDWAVENRKQWLDALMADPDPAHAKKAGRKVPIDADTWVLFSQQVMRVLIHLKFAHPYWRARLLATGDAVLIEGNTWGDIVWGQVNGKGKNLLGKILMDERDLALLTPSPRSTS